MASSRRLRHLAAVLALGVALLASTLPPAAAKPPAPSAAIAITTPGDGAEVTDDRLTVSGTSTLASELTLVIGAQKLQPVDVDPATGNWSTEVDVSGVDGRLDLAIRGRDDVSRYTTWSNFIAINVQNPDAAAPGVRIVSPAEGAVPSTFTVAVAVDSPNDIRTVRVRMNGARWERARHNRATGLYELTVRGESLGQAYASLEAQAIDRHGNEAISPTRYVSLGGARAATPLRYDQDRAIWVWERAAYEAVFDKKARNHLGSVLQDTTTFASDPIRTIYLGVDSYQGRDMLRDDRQSVAEFVTWARGQGFNVQATVAGGTRPPYFGALEQFEHFAVAEFEKVLNYNLSVPEEARFDGINVDIEPYILPQWKEPGTTLPTRWLEVLSTLIERRDASGLPVLVGPAIPRWLDSSACCTTVNWKGQTKPLSDHIQDLVDYVSIMDYRDSATGPAGIIAQAAHEIAYANQIGKPNSVVVGIETKDLSGTGDPETVTFWEEGRDYLEEQLDLTYAAFGNESSFGGIAMHHYDSLLALPSVWGGQGVRYPTRYPSVKTPE